MDQPFMHLYFSWGFFIWRKFPSASKSSVTDIPTSDASNSLGIPVAPTNSTIIDQGLAVSFSVKPLPDQPELTEIRFAFTDPSSGQPIDLESPSLVWIGSQQAQVLDPQGNGILTRQDKIKLYIQGTLDYRLEIDLNSYFVLTLNEDPSISVIDPLCGVTGISQLYAMVELKSPGEDWVLSADGKKLFVTLPKVNQVAVVDTENFSVLKYIDAGKNPMRIALQPDGRYVWAANDTNSLNSAGITIIESNSLAVAANIPTGTGQHEIIFPVKFSTSIRTRAKLPPALPVKPALPLSQTSREPYRLWIRTRLILSQVWMWAMNSPALVIPARAILFMLQRAKAG